MEKSFLNQPKPFLVFSLIFSVIGLSLLLGGVKLMFLGGSLYYLLSGTILLAIAWTGWSNKASAAILYQLLLSATIVWSIYEVGFDVWGLIPSLVAPAVLGVIFLLPPIQKRLSLNKLVNLITSIIMLLVLVFLGFSFFN